MPKEMTISSFIALVASGRKASEGIFWARCRLWVWAYPLSRPGFLLMGMHGVKQLHDENLHIHYH
jgi:hypothetical protein